MLLESLTSIEFNSSKKFSKRIGKKTRSGSLFKSILVFDCCSALLFAADQISPSLWTLRILTSLEILLGLTLNHKGIEDNL